VAGAYIGSHTARAAFLRAVAIRAVAHKGLKCLALVPFREASAQSGNGCAVKRPLSQGFSARRARAELLRLMPALLTYVADRVGVVSQSTNRVVVRAWRQGRRPSAGATGVRRSRPVFRGTHCRTSRPPPRAATADSRAHRNRAVRRHWRQGSRAHQDGSHHEPVCLTAVTLVKPNGTPSVPARAAR
jgi:hypothetical protein